VDGIVIVLKIAFVPERRVVPLGVLCFANTAASDTQSGDRDENE
jgi:hypothetical protein